VRSLEYAIETQNLVKRYQLARAYSIKLNIKKSTEKYLFLGRFLNLCGKKIENFLFVYF
jgi:hypothetical protein